MVDESRIKFLGNVPGQNTFGFNNGKTANNLEELYAILKDSDDAIFYEHVKDQKNDFANWIRYCVFHISLSDRLSSQHKKEDFMNVLRQEIESIRGVTVSSQPVQPSPAPAPTTPAVSSVQSSSAVPVSSLTSVSSPALAVPIVSPTVASPPVVADTSIVAGPAVAPVTSSASVDPVVVPATPSFIEEIFDFESIFKGLIDDLEHDVLSWDEHTA